MNQPFIIGITGGSGSGKTTLIRQLEANFSKEQVCMLSMDNYYKPRDLQERDGKNINELENLNWKVLVVWQCEIKNISYIAEKINSFLIA